MAEVRISAEQRTEFGKGGARRTRRAGKLPAVLYGHGIDPRHLSLPSREFEHALRTDGANVLLDLQIEGGSSELALPKSIQRDPVRGVIEHVDLIMVRRGEKITVEVPVTIEGALVSGGLLEQQLMTIALIAEATHLPSGVTVSIEGLEVGSAVHASDVTLPAGSEIAGEPDQVIAQILSAPTQAQMEAEPGGESGEAAPVVEAAPAADSAE